MKTMERKEGFELWGKWWNEMQKEWFKLEVLQDYYGEDKGLALDAWLSDDKTKSIELIRAKKHNEWVKSCQQKIDIGVKLLRLHIVEEPYTPYIEYEIEYYKNVNIPKCGEQVFLIKKEETKNLEIPSGDVMIFDNQRVVVNTYDSTGFVTHQTFYEVGDDISKYLELRSVLLKLAMPLKIT